jgi:hypothetical protein
LLKDFKAGLKALLEKQTQGAGEVQQLSSMQKNLLKDYSKKSRKKI